MACCSRRHTTVKTQNFNCRERLLTPTIHRCFSDRQVRGHDSVLHNLWLLLSITLQPYGRIQSLCVYECINLIEVVRVVDIVNYPVVALWLISGLIMNVVAVNTIKHYEWTCPSDYDGVCCITGESNFSWHTRSYKIHIENALIQLIHRMLLLQL